jgi:hypothetical protein
MIARRGAAYIVTRRRLFVGVFRRRWRRTARGVARRLTTRLMFVLLRRLAMRVLRWRPRILSRIVAGRRTEIAARAERRLTHVWIHGTARWRAGARIETGFTVILRRPVVVRRRIVLRQRRRRKKKNADGNAERAHQYLRQSSR